MSCDTNPDPRAKRRRWHSIGAHAQQQQPQQLLYGEIDNVLQHAQTQTNNRWQLQRRFTDSVPDVSVKRYRFRQRRAPRTDRVTKSGSTSEILGRFEIFRA
jgi:hypothetical protein